MLLATRADVNDRLTSAGHDGLAEGHEIGPLLEEASVMVEEYLRRTYTAGSTIPRSVTIVTSRMVARRIIADESSASEVPDGVSSLGATDYQASFAEPFVSVGVWMTRNDKAMISRYRVSAVSIAVSSDRTPRPPADCDD